MSKSYNGINRQSTGWSVRDPTSRNGRGKGVLWDMRELQAAWPLHGRLRVALQSNKVKDVPGV